MSGNLLGALVVPLAALVGVVTMFVHSLALRAWYWAVEWPARRRVRLAVERETARRIGGLVPGQRSSADPVWWEFVPAPRDPGAGGVIPAQRDGDR